MNEIREEKEFLLFDSDTFTVTTVIGLATEHPGSWFVSGKGTYPLGVCLFSDMSSVRDYATTLLNRRVEALNKLKEAYSKL